MTKEKGKIEKGMKKRKKYPELTDFNRKNVNMNIRKEHQSSCSIIKV